MEEDEASRRPDSALADPFLSLAFALKRLSQ